jgi:dipeptidyl aminopeptidase/acylaminoacyl peptidase
MYFTAHTDSGDHLWRQRFPRGEPEQLTFGPAEAQGVAVAPDGRSVITSLGMRQGAIWVHDSRGDRPISSMGFASSPKFSADGARVFYLLNRGGPDSQSELWVVDLGTGKSDRLVSGRQIVSYDIARDRSEAVLAVRTSEGKSEIWLAPFDKRAAPVRIASNGEESPFFGVDGQIVFRQSDGKANYLFRMNRDGSGRAKIVPHSILNLMSVSPDGHWITALVAVSETPATFAEMAIPTLGGAPKRICPGFCLAEWAPDMRHFYVTLTFRQEGQTTAIPVPEGKALPDLPPGGIRSVEEGIAMPKDLAVDQAQFAPGLSPSVYAYVKTAIHRNLFRVPVP